MHSCLEVLDIATGKRRVVLRTDEHIEAPNWTPDGLHFIVNGGGHLFRVPVDGSGGLSQIDTGEAVRCNNDHGLSPDGSLLAVSHHIDIGSVVYVLPATGGVPRRVTALGPSYWHGWSPDGATLAYTANRTGQFDVYTISVDGGHETRLTTDPAPDDGPDFSPDGTTIFYNSQRSGVMRIWAMDPDGSNQRQLSFDDAYADWFPHPCPDGRWCSILSYGADVTGHPPGKDVCLRLLELSTGATHTVAELFGGQGTMNVPSWAPDSSAFAFVSYEL